MSVIHTREHYKRCRARSVIQTMTSLLSCSMEHDCNVIDIATRDDVCAHKMIEFGQGFNVTVRPSIHDVYSSGVDEKDAGVTTSDRVRVEGMSRCNVGRRSSSSSRQNKTDDTYVRHLRKLGLQYVNGGRVAMIERVNKTTTNIMFMDMDVIRGMSNVFRNAQTNLIVLDNPQMVHVSSMSMPHASVRMFRGNVFVIGSHLRFVSDTSIPDVPGPDVLQSTHKWRNDASAALANDRPAVTTDTMERSDDSLYANNGRESHTIRTGRYDTNSAWECSSRYPGELDLHSPVASVASQCIDDVYSSDDDAGMDESLANTTNESRTTTNKTTTTTTNDSESFTGNNIHIL